MKLETYSYEYRGHRYWIVMRSIDDLGLHKYYCGYVELPSDHPYYDMDCDDIPIDCHGGLTYCRPFMSESRVIGYDCMHSGDSLSKQDLVYNEKECRKIIDQLESARR